MSKDNLPDKGTEKNISENELHEKLDMFEQLAETPEDKFAVMRFRNNYLDAKEKAAAKNGLQREHFQQGLQKGIHAEQQKSDLDKNQQLEGEKLKKDTLKATKGYYHSNYSLKIKFTEKTVVKGKDIPIDGG